MFPKSLKLPPVEKLPILMDQPRTTPEGRASELKIIAQGAWVSFLGYLSMILLNFVFQWLIARVFGPEGVGILGLSLTIIQIATSLALFGLRDSVVRFVALYQGIADRARTAGVMVSGGLMVIFTGCMVAFAVYLCAHRISEYIFHKPETGRVLSALAFSIPFTALMTIFLAVAQGMKRMEYETAIEKMAVPFLKVCAVLMSAWLFGKTLIGAAYGILAASMTGAALAAISVWRLYPLGSQKEKPVLETKILLSFSCPLLLTSILERSGEQVETIVLGAFAASQQVGIYYMALRTTVFLTAIFLSLSSIFAPIMAEVYGRMELDRLSRLLKTVTRWGISLCMPIFILYVCLSEEIMSVFGEDFKSGAVVIQWLALSQLLNISTGPVGWLLIMSGHSRISLANTLLVLILNIGLAFTFIPDFGMIGAAASAALSISAINLLRLAEVYSLLRMHPYDRTLLKPLAAGLFTWAAVTFLRDLMAGFPTFCRFGILGLLLMILYLAAMLALKLDGEDLLIIDTFAHRIRQYLDWKPKTV